ncbi:MAG: DUF1573 domain-containing protein [Bdellovibrionota bacterium]
MFCFYTTIPTISAWAQAGKIKFSESHKSFGEVYRGQILEHSFSFSNAGNGQLRIKGVYSQCGCTIIQFEKEKSYLPGESGVIKVLFNTENFAGQLIKAITIFTSEAKNSSKSLKLSAKIREEFELSPPMIDFGEVLSDEGGNRKTKFKSVKPGELGIDSFEYDKDKFIIDFSKEGSYWAIEVRLRPGQQSGFLKENIYLLNNSKYLPRLKIPVRANVVGNLKELPNYIEFGSIGKNKSIKRSIKLSSNKGIQISDFNWSVYVNGVLVNNGNDFVKVELSNKGKASKHEINLIIHNDSQRQGSVHGYVTLMTDDPLQEEVRIPFFAFFG